MIHGNEDQLIRMLLNLLDNAIGYTPPGGRIALSCTREKGSILISISDTGPGIAPEHAPRVFDYFYHLDCRNCHTQGESGFG